MGFTITAQQHNSGQATHRRRAAEALAVARAFAAVPAARVQIAADFGEVFSVEAFAAALAAGRFKVPRA